MQCTTAITVLDRVASSQSSAYSHIFRFFIYRETGILSPNAKKHSDSCLNAF